MEAWQVDCITLPQTPTNSSDRSNHRMPGNISCAQCHHLDLAKQVLWQHGTPERTESDNGTHFQNNLLTTWAKEHGIKWVYHIASHAQPLKI